MRVRLLLGAAALFAFLVVPIAVAQSGGDPRATASAAKKGKVVKKLRKQMNALSQRLAALEAERGAARTPAGGAGGDLSGQYPAPAIAASAVNSAKVADGSLTGLDLGDGSVSSGNVADGSLAGIDVADGSLAGIDVEDDSLAGIDVTDNSLTGFDVANGSLSSADANATLQDSCTLGAVTGHTLVDGANVGAAYASTGVAESFNCGGTPVLAKDNGAGDYNVCFQGNFPWVVLVSAITNGAADKEDNIVSWRRVSDAQCSGGVAVNVKIRDVDGTAEDGSFTAQLLGM